MTTKSRTEQERTGLKRIRTEHIIVLLIFLLVLGMRIFFSLNSGLDYQAYNTLRQAEHIKATGTPLFSDPLSYQGRTAVFPPLFYYLIAGISVLIPLQIAAKIISCISISSLVIIVYLITRHMTKNKTASIIASLFSGLVPVTYTLLNKASPYSLALPLIFLLSYAYMRITEKRYASTSIILSIILLLTNASVLIILLSFLLYFLIIKLEKRKIMPREVEVGVFLFFLALWFNILMYKKAFFTHGIRFVWQNTPLSMLSAYFQELSFLGVIHAVGFVPLLLGVYAAYHIFFKTKNKNASLYISFLIISFVMLWLRLIPFNAGLLLLSTNLIILSSYSIKILLVSISKTKIRWVAKPVLAILVLVFLLTTIISAAPYLGVDAPAKADLEALEWIKNNTLENTVILGRIKEGHLISFAAHRKNVADTNFLLIKNIDQRYADVSHLYTSRFKSEAVRLINEYNIDYILLSAQASQEYKIESLYYADQECFKLVYEQEAKIYKFLKCKIE